MSAVLKAVPTIVRGMSNETYHGSEGISNSGLGWIGRSPWHYWSWYLAPNRPPQPKRAGQLEGNLLHCAALEPGEFDKRYVLGPSVHRNTKVWKDWVAANSDRIPIQGDQYETAMAQAQSIRALPEIAEALETGHAEVSAFWHDPETGVLCKCRPDFVHESQSGVVLIDLKTYSDASRDEFRLQIARKSYHRQAAFYSDGYELASGRRVLGFIFVAVETEWPYAACAVMLDDDSLEAGRVMYRRNLDLYAECLRTDKWPSYSSAIELVRLPNYALEATV